VTLRASLAWDVATYDAVKYSLIATRQILPGKGRGGSVSLASSQPQESAASPESADVTGAVLE
jgi:type I restriction enzyme M protein